MLQHCFTHTRRALPFAKNSSVDIIVADNYRTNDASVHCVVDSTRKV